MKSLYFKKDIDKIKKDCQRYLDFILVIGNECSTTDRILEDIIKDAKQLEKHYSKKFGGVSYETR